MSQFPVEHGADPTVQDKNGSTPLQLASKNGHVKVAQFLVERGADPTVRDKNEWTPLDLASKNGHVEVAQFLVGRGADPTVQEEGGPLCIWRRTMDISKLCSSL